MADKRQRLTKNKENDRELIADLKKREKKLKAELKEKETLLKEIHHRVKNNIQIISSLLRLQAGAVQLFHLAGANPSAVRLEVRVKNVRLKAKKAVPCGLIINELVLNALKYAFPQGKSGTIRIEMKPQAGGHYSLMVSDNGVGLPDSIDVERPERFGFQIVADLVRPFVNTVTYSISPEGALGGVSGG